MIRKHAHWRSQDFTTGGGGGQRAEEREGREILDNSCIKMALCTCNCRVNVIVG